MLAPYHTLNVASYFHCPIHAKVLSGGSVIKGDGGMEDKALHHTFQEACLNPRRTDLS